MSNWKERQSIWKHERKQHFNESNQQSPRTPKLTGSSDSEPANSVHQVTANTQVFNQLHSDTISVLRVRVYNSKFYFNGFPSGQVTLIRGQSYIIDLSHPSNRGHQLVISRSTTHGAVNGMVSIGEQGNPGAFIALFIGSGRPHSLYYYCTIYRGMGGDISIVDSNDM